MVCNPELVKCGARQPWTLEGTNPQCPSVLYLFDVGSELLSSGTLSLRHHRDRDRDHVRHHDHDLRPRHQLAPQIHRCDNS